MGRSGGCVGLGEVEEEERVVVDGSVYTIPIWEGMASSKMIFLFVLQFFNDKTLSLRALCMYGALWYL